MGTPIEYQKLMTEIVYINLPGPEEAAPNMTGGELLHGFLAELYRIPNAEFKDPVELFAKDSTPNAEFAPPVVLLSKER